MLIQGYYQRRLNLQTAPRDSIIWWSVSNFYDERTVTDATTAPSGRPINTRALSRVTESVIARARL